MDCARSKPEDDSEDGDVSYITYYGGDLKLSARDYLVDPLYSRPREIPAAITYPVATPVSTPSNDGSRSDPTGILPTETGSTSQSTVSTESNPSLSSTTSEIPTSTRTSISLQSTSSTYQSEIPTPTSSISPNGPGGLPQRLGSVNSIALWSVLGGIIVVLILLAIGWLKMWKAMPQDGLTIHMRNWKFWRWGRGRIEDQEKLECQKPELDAVNTGIGYNPGAPHELHVTRTGYDEPAELDALRSPVEVPGSFSYV